MSPCAHAMGAGDEFSVARTLLACAEAENSRIIRRYGQKNARFHQCHSRDVRSDHRAYVPV